MREQKTAVWIFSIGFFSLVLLGIIGLFFLAIIEPTETTYTSSENINNSIVVTPTTAADPLVTVIPEAGVQGTPRMIASDPRRGATQPTVTIMEFGDFQCSDCAAMAEIIARIVKEYPNDVRHVWKDFPITSEHKQAEEAAYAARCAAEQDAFWEYHDYLLTNQTAFPLLPWKDFAVTIDLDIVAFEACMEKGEQQYAVAQSFTVAKTLGLTTAPSYYINDQFFSGPLTYEELKAIVEEEISKKNNGTKNE